jgi:HSP20 family protein
MAEKQTEVMSDRQQDQARQDRTQSNPQNNPQTSALSQDTKGSQTRQDQGRQENRLAQRDQALLMSPFSLLQRFFNDDILGAFDIFGGGRGSMASETSRGARSQSSTVSLWAPAVDVFQRGNELIIRADLPGVRVDDVAVEISDDAITISGERAQEQEEERGGVYRFERTYGAFSRVIPLPEGAIVDQAKASFKNGVLEITVPAPPEQVSRGRRLEISKESDRKTEGSSSEKRG